MVYIVTGKINSGKTTRLLSIYNERKAGDGFINKKIYINNKYAGQEIIRLSTGDSKIFSLKKAFLTDEWQEEYSYDVYSFSKEGMPFAEEIIKDIIDNDISPIFIDEIGPIELQGLGFYKVFKEILKTKKDIFVVVREGCLEKVISQFEIGLYEIV